MKDLFSYKKEELVSSHFFARYRVRSNTEVKKAAWEIAIGQSVGNPNVRNKWETDKLFEDHSCKIVSIESTDTDSIIEIAFPYINLDWDTDGVSQLLCMLQGGQTDIANIRECRLVGLEAPGLTCKPPKFGISNFRAITKNYDRPFLGAIIKPKTGISKEVLLDMVKELIDGGVDFIKEDEILSNPSFCSIKDRVPYIMNYINKLNKKIIYSVCINSDPLYLIDRVKMVNSMGGNSVHVNVWSGLGAYKSIRDLDLPIFIHYQKSGEKVFTNSSSKYSISWDVLSQLAGMCGVDSIHAGMIGGYASQDDITNSISILRSYNVVPALSCGMHPGLVKYIKSKIGIDWMANVGGAVHGHPNGSLAGARAMRQAIDGNYGKEYAEAVNQWGVQVC